MPKAKTYRSPAVDTAYDLGRCIYADECVKGLRQYHNDWR
jgi:uncharacterized Fe-S cluster protein YjdI